MNKNTPGEQARMVVPSDLIDAATVAGLLAVTTTTITRRAKAGTLPSLAQLACGVWVFDRTEVLAAAAGGGL